MFSILERESLLSRTAKNVSFVELEFSVADIDRKDFSVRNISLPSGFDKMVAKRRCGFLAGRLCATRALQRAGVFSQVGTAHGGNPIWPEGYIGSISHTDTRAVACAVTTEHFSAVGLDTEIIMTSDLAYELAPLLLNQPECRGSDLMPFNHYVTLVFSAKEALYKSLYPNVGVFFGFEAASLIELDESMAKFEIQQDLSSRWFKGSIVDIEYIKSESRIYSFCSVL